MAHVLEINTLALFCIYSLKFWLTHTHQKEKLPNSFFFFCFCFKKDEKLQKGNSVRNCCFYYFAGRQKNPSKCSTFQRPCKIKRKKKSWKVYSFSEERCSGAIDTCHVTVWGNNKITCYFNVIGGNIIGGTKLGISLSGNQWAPVSIGNFG